MVGAEHRVGEGKLFIPVDGVDRPDEGVDGPASGERAWLGVEGADWPGTGSG